MSDTDFTVVYVGRNEESATPDAIHRFNIGDRLKVTNVSLSSTTGNTYYAIADGWYNARLFKRLDDIRAERLQEIGI